MGCCVHGVPPTMDPALRSCRFSPPPAAGQYTTAPIMIAATAPIGESRPSNSTRTSEANRIVAMVMPETGWLDEPTSPDRYADTETNRKPATIMMIVIGMLDIHWQTREW